MNSKNSKEALEQAEKKTEKNGFFRMVLLSLLFSFFAVLLYHFVFVKPELKKLESRIPAIKVVPFKEYISSLKTLYVDGDIDDEELKKELKRFKHLLHSQPKNVILFSDTAVLNADSMEKLKVLSPEIKKKLKEYLKRKEKKKGGRAMEEKKVKNGEKEKKRSSIAEHLRNMPPEERRKKVLLATGIVFLIVLIMGFIFK